MSRANSSAYAEHRDISLPRSNSVAFGAKRTLSRSQSRIFEYTSYKIRMMKLQMRVGGMFWCAPPPPVDWIEMPVPAKLMPMPVAAALSETPEAGLPARPA